MQHIGFLRAFMRRLDQWSYSSRIEPAFSAIIVLVADHAT